MNTDKRLRSAGSGNRFLTPLKKAYARFLKIRGTPREIALGLALGLFVGMTPFMGLHLAIAIPLAALFKWNKFAAGSGVFITNYITAPIIYSFTYWVGAKILGIRRAFSLANEEGFSAFTQLMRNAPEIVTAMVVGGAVLGLPLAIMGYYLAYSLVYKYQRDIKAKLVKSKEKLALKKALRKQAQEAPDTASNPHRSFENMNTVQPPAEGDPSPGPAKGTEQ